MKGLTLLKALVAMGLFVAAFLLPLYSLGFDVSTILTVITFLFSILIGFFIAAAMANYLNFQDCLAQENSSLILFFNLGSIVQPSARKKIGAVIDRYVIATLDYHLGDYIEKTQKEFDEVISTIDALSPAKSNHKGSIVLQVLHGAKADLLRTRQSLFLRAVPQVVRREHWIILISLAVSLAILLFSFRNAEIISGLIVGIICTVLFLILLLLWELDSNLFLEQQLAFTDTQRVFEEIGTLPYYPAYAIENGAVDLPKGNYRVGVYKNYPRSLEKVIKIIRQKS